MSKVKPCRVNGTGALNGNFYFKCPATNQQIEVSTQTAWTPGQIVYGFNGDLERPTFSQAIKLVNGKPLKAGEIVNDSNATTINHFVVMDGNIRYFDDCTHPSKGRTLELIELK